MISDWNKKYDVTAAEADILKTGYKLTLQLSANQHTQIHNTLQSSRPTSHSESNNANKTSRRTMAETEPAWCTRVWAHTRKRFTNTDNILNYAEFLTRTIIHALHF